MSALFEHKLKTAYIKTQPMPLKFDEKLIRLLKMFSKMPGRKPVLGVLWGYSFTFGKVSVNRGSGMFVHHLVYSGWQIGAGGRGS